VADFYSWNIRDGIQEAGRIGSHHDAKLPRSQTKFFLIACMRLHTGHKQAAQHQQKSLLSNTPTINHGSP
jgi:hypothetical protein